MTVPTQYPVDKKMETPSRIPLAVFEISSPQGQNLAVHEDARWSRNANGHTVTPTPIAKDIPRMNLVRRLCTSRLVAASEIPLTNTLENRKMVIPPRTQSGILLIIPEIFPKTPMMMSQIPQAYPARRDAHLVKAMTPLF